MGRSRPPANPDGRPDIAASVAIDMEGESSAANGARLSSEPAPLSLSSAARQRRTRVGAILGLALVGVGVAALVISGTTRSARSVTDPDDRALSEQPAPSPSTQPTIASSPAELTAELLDQLPTTADELVAGQVIAWIGADDQLHVRRLSDGEDLDTGVLAQRNLPPLPQHIRLLGAPNSTWLLDLTEPEQSGKLSNTVRMVRLGSDLDSYGFISTTDDETQFFVGSLWGPSMNGTATVPRSSAVFPVAQTGIVVASQSAVSGVVEGGGIRLLPPRLGRIVAASNSLVAGIHCDDLGRCVGRVSDWEGENEVQIDASGLSSPVVRISPDGRYIAAASNTEWRIYDLDRGTSRVTRQRIGVNETLAWSSDSNLLLWLSNGAILAIDVQSDSLSPTRVRQAGDIGERLPESDIAILFE